MISSWVFENYEGDRRSPTHGAFPLLGADRQHCHYTHENFRLGHLTAYSAVRLYASLCQILPMGVDCVSSSWWRDGICHSWCVLKSVGSSQDKADGNI